MKKFLAIFLTLTMLVLVACSNGNNSSGDKELATATKKVGIVDYTMKLYGSGDKINRIVQISVINNVNDEIRAKIDSSKKSFEDLFNSIEGASYKGEYEGDKYVETHDLNVGNEKTYKTLNEKGLLPVTNKNTNKISYSDSIKALQNSGWTVTENK